MGRENGLHVLFGTQGLADLTKIDKSFMEKITNCANTIICHRLNNHANAELVAQWVGTKNGFAVTAQINVTEGDSGVGTVRETRGFIIHPDFIKQELDPGEAFYITKVDGFKSGQGEGEVERGLDGGLFGFARPSHFDNNTSHIRFNKAINHEKH